MLTHRSQFHLWYGGGFLWKSVRYYGFRIWRCFTKNVWRKEHELIEMPVDQVSNIRISTVKRVVAFERLLSCLP